MKLTTQEQRKLMHALPAHRIAAVRAHCSKCEMRGEGLASILKSMTSVLGPVAREVGPTVLRELVVPFLKKKIAGKGLRLAGQRGRGYKVKAVR
jgi:hypothetical protein